MLCVVVEMVDWYGVEVYVCFECDGDGLVDVVEGFDCDVECYVVVVLFVVFFGEWEFEQFQIFYL